MTMDFAYLIHESMNTPIVYIQTGKEVLPEIIRSEKAYLSTL